LFRPGSHRTRYPLCWAQQFGCKWRGSPPSAWQVPFSPDNIWSSPTGTAR